MTSKEALEELKNNFGLGVIGKSLCDIIENDLIRLETGCYMYKSCYEKAIKYYNSLRKNYRVLLEINDKLYKNKEKYKEVIKILDNALEIYIVDDEIGVENRSSFIDYEDSKLVEEVFNVWEEKSKI